MGGALQAKDYVTSRASDPSFTHPIGPLKSLTGTAGGELGTGIAGPQGAAGVEQPVNAGTIYQSQQGVNQSLGNSNVLLAALQAQNGIGNQGQAFNQGQSLLNAINGVNGTGTMANAIGGQGALAGQLGGAGGIGAQTSAIGGLQGTLGQLQRVANGTGPNPAQAMLNQATGANVANQAALMAGQRGAGANAGLMARQAAQQGAGIQQQAAGQAATMQANQQLNALGQMTAANQALAGVGAGLTGQQQAALGQLYNQGAGATNLQQAQLGQNAGIAQNQVANTMGQQGQVLQGNLANTGQQMQALGGYNTNLINMQGNINTGNAALANTQLQGQQAMLGGLMGGMGAGAGMFAGGGMVGYADGGETEAPYAAPEGQGPVLQETPAPQMTPAPVVVPNQPEGPQSSLGQYLAGQTSTSDFMKDQPPIAAVDQKAPPDTAMSNQVQSPIGMGYGSQALQKGAQKMGMAMGAGLMAMSQGGMTHDYRGGGNVQARAPQEKASVSGNSYKNDKVKAMLSEGEVVIPRDVMQSKDPVSGAAKFVEAILAKKKGNKAS